MKEQNAFLPAVIAMSADIFKTLEESYPRTTRRTLVSVLKLASLDGFWVCKLKIKLKTKKLEVPIRFLIISVYSITFPIMLDISFV